MSQLVKIRFARKPVNIDEVKAAARDLDDRGTICRVSETVEMNVGEYDAFARTLMDRRQWLAGKGGWRNGHLQAIEVKAPGRPTLYVNPEGSDYGRYVGMALPQEHEPLGFSFPICN